MACDRWREMLSAQLDGEDDPADRPRVDEHVAGCAACREWLDQAAAVNRLTRTSLATPVPDLTAAILAAVPERKPPLLSRAWLFVALAAVGAVQLILGLSQVGGVAGSHTDHAGLDATPGHLWHESAAWNVAVGAAFLFIALRRSRPSGLVPMLTAFVGMLLLLSVNDLSAGRVDAQRLISHGFVLVGYLLVVALSRKRTAPAPPGSHATTGWRAHFDEAEDTVEEAPAGPRLRLVPRTGPMTARHEERRAA
ncbi:zf-HC2 domain-containing protein [Actinoplanes sp. NBRC 103695]|uniref:zf-HC2 domain-containing protein n=1 Tax=Actinoplanes sp. NBRC 103695 TaxID=3032202 RepID=UPI002552313D|nr:zf-HC2 domain-containing protein [Actinoplanes sp. NBRC 103695]